MKVITNNDVIVSRVPRTSNACGCGGYSSLDGDDSSKVREFQVWASMNKGAQLVADGKYGPLTKAAYAKWGEEWEKTQTKSPAPTAPEGTVTVKPIQSKGINVYAPNNEPIKTVAAGGWVGTYFGDRDKDSVYVNTTSGKGWVWKSGVNITAVKSKAAPIAPTPSLFKTPQTPKTADTTTPVMPVSEKKTLMQKWSELKMPVKAGIIVGGALLVAGIVWVVIPGKKK